jgi:surface carbohydrate biosynthesis protein
LKKNLFLPIEIKHREFFSKLFLASYAIKSGFRVYIGSSDSIFRLIKTKKQKGGIFFYKGGLELNKILELKKKCDHFVVLDEELGTEKNNFSKVARRRIWPGTEKFISRYYVISKFGYKASRNVFTEMKDRVRCTGWPRVDLWKKENSYLFKKETELIKKKYGKFILFSSDFTYNSKKVINDRSNAVRMSEWKLLRKEFLKRKKLSNTVYEDYNHFLKILLDYDKIKGLPQIIIRPHPTEDLDAWYEFSKKVKNIKVIYKGEITPWINASSGLLHRGCMSAIQAFMRRIPVGHYILNDTKYNETPYKISEHLFTVKDLIRFCKNSIKKNYSQKLEKSKEFNKMIYINPNKMSAKLITKDLSNLNTKKESSCEVNCINEFLVDLKIYIKSYIKKLLIYLSIISENFGVVSNFKKIPNGIKKDDITKFFNILVKDNKIKIKKVFKDCIEIDL